ncbi:DUF2207 domain-containing protein [Candidatus Saccharibacteria bacterium]|nr:DUF2207 domain-containing protein [Candidatus Saccharibacteria bacterium]
MFSVAVQRIRVSIWLRSHLSYAEYEPYVDPPTAGFIIDYEFSNEEIWALVFYLWRKNILDITVQGKELIIRKLPKTTVNGLDIIERAFTDELFGMNGNYVVNSLHDRSFLRAGRMSHDVLAQYLLARGFDTAYLKPNKAIKNFARIVFFVAGFVGILLFSATIFDYEHVFTVAYPRYPVAPVQIIALSFVWLSVLAVIFFGFLGSFTKSRYSEVVITIARAEGYKNFLKTVYSAKFAEDKINTLPTNELIQIAPYMIAFKLVPLKMEYIRNLIKTINDKKGN